MFGPISLTFEQQGLRESVADVALLGAMTGSLSREIANRICWFDMGQISHGAIMWDLLPSDETSPRVPSPPWIFSYEPHLVTAQNRWWEGGNESGEKPQWWNDPAPEVCSPLSTP